MTSNTDAPVTIDRWIAMSDLMSSPDAKAVLTDEIPEILETGAARTFAGFPLGVFLTITLSSDPDRTASILERLAAVPHPAPRPTETPARVPSEDYEPASVPVGSAHLTAPATVSGGDPIELVIAGPSHGNPFVDVELGARFTCGDRSILVGGFYDGDGTYRIRFLPPTPGDWTAATRSNARSLTGLQAEIEVGDGPTSSPVRVDGFGFARPDGTPFVPVGTTAYAWTHQPEEVQERTLASLAGAPFNKLRMGLFPKAFLYNDNEPERFVFPRTADGGWDLERFDVDWFRHFEHRLAQLAALGIEADLILFHPYDRWGFSSLGAAADDRYVRYVVRRLAAMPNVWWSLANEYELSTAKRPEDWDRLGRLVAAEDHVGHPRSIHNIVEPWDATADWVTHASVQHGATDIAGQIDRWRAQWRKPVLIDEMGYEGDLDQGWGNLTAEEVVLGSWQVALRGGYFTHGETFWRDDEEIFWAKGGDLRGESAARIGFLRDVIAASPTGRLEPLPSEFDAVWSGVAGRYVIVSFGRGRPRFRNIPIPQGYRARIEILDTWAMTTTEVPGEHEGTVHVDLPARSHIAVRLRLTAAA